jgi:hypothetical protein
MLPHAPNVLPASHRPIAANVAHVSSGRHRPEVQQVPLDQRERAPRPGTRVATRLAGFVSALVSALVALLALSPCASALDYAGIGAATDPTSLRERFPDSRHEFWQRGTGSIIRAEDRDGRFESMLKEGDGLYIV